MRRKNKGKFKMTRRQVLKAGMIGGAGLMVPWKFKLRMAYAVQNNGSLDPTSITKYASPMVIPPAMPKDNKGKKKGFDYYEIAVRQFQQQILPSGMPSTTVWSYGSVSNPATFNYPAFTIEAAHDKEVRVNWINDLVAKNGKFLPHILPVDQTLHWANPPGGIAGRDMHGASLDPYLGPVPTVTHVHGAHTFQYSDGYPEAWYLPAAKNIPKSYATRGTFYDQFAGEFKSATNQGWNPGTAVFMYPNDQRATTLWYHDHSLGMTRLNVYAGPAGFYLIRGGPDGDGEVGDGSGGTAILPNPAPDETQNPTDPTGIYEIPIVIQDRAFNQDGSLFYPDNRAFFEENMDATGNLDPDQLQIPFWGEQACPLDDPTAVSDVPPIWQPEYFGNVMVVNGVSWPKLQVEQQQYRFRLLNGCNSRFLILDFSGITGVEVWQIGADGGFLSAPVDITSYEDNKILMAPAERADVIVDFRNVNVDSYLLANLGPDDPFGGGDFDPADPATTGLVMQFDVVARGPMSPGESAFTEPGDLLLPSVTPPTAGVNPRALSLIEEESKTVKVIFDGDGNLVLDCESSDPFGPTAALLGASSNEADGGLLWSDPITEDPEVGATETWEIHNFTADAHPIHIHLVQFQVVGRELIGGGDSVAGSNDPLPGETGFKDTVISYPGEITRVQATFDQAGLFVWHCHIVEHEDNEMMRPYEVV
jgi:FtsP/CotA-like multicopper oxidase with cupredoxin domain